MQRDARTAAHGSRAHVRQRHTEVPADPRQVLALTVAYDGADFAGFARQPGQRTVQGELEQALSIALRRPVEVVGAGRTDAGVHALGQVVSFPCDADDLDDRALLRSLNALGGDGIVVREMRRARPGFSARFDAVEREYRYRIVAGPGAAAVPSAGRVVDAAGARRRRDARGRGAPAGRARLPVVLPHRVGRGQAAPSAGSTSIEIAEEEHLGERCLVVRVVGNAFLHSMVRVIVGTLVEVGAGRREPGWVAEALGRVRPERRRPDGAGARADAVAASSTRTTSGCSSARTGSRAGYARRRVFVDASACRDYYVRVRFSSPVKVRTEHAVLYS